MELYRAGIDVGSTTVKVAVAMVTTAIVVKGIMAGAGATATATASVAFLRCWR